MHEEDRTQPTSRVRLGRDAGLPEVIEAVNELSVTLAQRLAVSPSNPLSGAHPSASVVYSDDEYDALADRLEAPPAPNDRLRHTMSSRPLSDEIRVEPLRTLAPPSRNGGGALDE